MKFVYQGFEPLDERFIVQPGPVHKILVKQHVPVKDKLESRKTPTTLVPTVEKEFMGRTEMRVGKILAVTSGSTYCMPGDWVVYFEKHAIPVDLLATVDGDVDCPILLKRYDIVMKVKDPNIEEIVKESIVKLETPLQEDNKEIK